VRIELGAALDRGAQVALAGSSGLLFLLGGGFGAVAVEEAALGGDAEEGANHLADDNGADNRCLDSTDATVAHDQEGGDTQGQAEPQPGQIGQAAGQNQPDALPLAGAQQGP